MNFEKMTFSLEKMTFSLEKNWKETHILQGIPFPLIYKLKTKSF
jgi:hypothetical protein